MIMALFGKKKEVVKAEPTCCCGGTEEVKAESTPCCGEKIDGVCCIKVLGAGCKSCHEQYENAKKAVENVIEKLQSAESITLHLRILLCGD